MNRQFSFRMPSRFLIGLPVGVLITSAAGCLHNQQSTGSDPGINASSLIKKALVLLGDFARALLAAFLF